MNTSLIKVPLINLTMATLLGALLRFIPIQAAIGINYKFILHTHSHIAFLGWVYMAIFLAILFVFVPENSRLKRTYKIQFWATQISVIGMFFTFPFQGYALYSIIFSTAQIILSYIFFITILKDIPAKIKSTLSYKFIFVAFIFMIISTIGPWSLGIIMANKMSNTYWYNLAIYFYLHFQYNGFFTFAILGLLIKLLEDKKIIFSIYHLKVFLILNIISCILGYFLNTLWIKPPVFAYVLSLIAAILQIISLFYLFRIIHKEFYKWFNSINLVSKALFSICIICFVIKTVLQFFAVLIPMFEIRNLIIAYLHLTLIGFITFFLLAYFQISEYLKNNSFYRKGIFFLIAGFILSEIILFAQGGLFWAGKGMIPAFYIILFSVSILMPIGLILLTFSQLQNKQE